MHLLSRFLLLGGLLGWSFFPIVSSGQADTTGIVSSHALDASEVRAFADAFFPAQLDSLHIPGAVFVVVQDTQVVFQQGYGRADVEAELPVDVTHTLFQVASISKLFTATAVMQLVEQGKLDLHTDVNEYLSGVQIDNAFDAPVTLHHLLTHTAGFDERNLGYFARDAASVRSLVDYLADRMPPRTLPAGTVISYSNHGFGLAGLIVEQTSGVPFATYMDQQVLMPLGMTHSTFHLPLPNTLADALAQGYRWNGEAFAAAPLFYRNVPPAGALSATGADLARFMKAHLRDGGAVLSPATKAQMHAQQFTHHPRLPGMAYGFIEQHKHGYRLLQHGGDNPGYGSLLFLLPEASVGVFMASNALSNTLRRRLMAQFMTRFFPASPPETRSPTPQGRDRLDRFT